jgi:hypothetical protein
MGLCLSIPTSHPERQRGKRTSHSNKRRSHSNKGKRASTHSKRREQRNSRHSGTKSRNEDWEAVLEKSIQDYKKKQYREARRAAAAGRVVTRA